MIEHKDGCPSGDFGPCDCNVSLAQGAREPDIVRRAIEIWSCEPWKDRILPGLGARTCGELGAALAAQPPAATVETKLVYVKRWRTLVNLPAKYADEIVEALRTPVECSSAGNATAAERNAWADELQAMIAAGEIPDNEMHKATTVLNLLRIPSEPQAVGWRPIETAPKDGTRIDVWFQLTADHGGRWANVSWSPEHEIWSNGPQSQYKDGWVATNWMPFPASPLSRPEHS